MQHLPQSFFACLPFASMFIQTIFLREKHKKFSYSVEITQVHFIATCWNPTEISQPVEDRCLFNIIPHKWHRWPHGNTYFFSFKFTFSFKSNRIFRNRGMCVKSVCFGVKLLKCSQRRFWCYRLQLFKGVIYCKKTRAIRTTVKVNNKTMYQYQFF